MSPVACRLLRQDLLVEDGPSGRAKRRRRACAKTSAPVLAEFRSAGPRHLAFVHAARPSPGECASPTLPLERTKCQLADGRELGLRRAGELKSIWAIWAIWTIWTIGR